MSVSDVDITCRDLSVPTAVTTLDGDGLDAGNLKGWSDWCAPGEAFCGVKTRADLATGGSNDEVGLTDLKFRCCFTDA